MTKPGGFLRPIHLSPSEDSVNDVAWQLKSIARMIEFVHYTFPGAVGAIVTDTLPSGVTLRCHLHSFRVIPGFHKIALYLRNYGFRVYRSSDLNDLEGPVFYVKAPVSLKTSGVLDTCVPVHLYGEFDFVDKTIANIWEVAHNLEEGGW